MSAMLRTDGCEKKYRVHSVVGWRFGREQFVDRGYRGAQHHPADTRVYLSGRKLSGTLKRLLRLRSAIEPVIGHLKQDHRMKRNYLKGQAGDQINALLVGSGFNLRNKLRASFSGPFSVGQSHSQNSASATSPCLILLIEI